MVNILMSLERASKGLLYAHVLDKCRKKRRSIALSVQTIL